jgi:hypothetical protein
MNVKKVKFIFMLSIFLLLFEKTESLTKCNRRLMNSFFLTGMEYSINKKMKICGNVQDKCCTIADEIKISKLWNDRVQGILDGHTDEYVVYLEKIQSSYVRLLEIDPRLIVVKYVHNETIPLVDDFCYSQEKYAKKNKDVIQLKVRKEQLNESKNKFFLNNISETEKNLTPEEIFRTRVTKFQEVNSFAQKFEYLDVSCRSEVNNFVKEYIIVNEEKSQYCFGLYQKFLNFDHKKFALIFPTIKAGLSGISKIKSSLYCSLCDAHQQRFFSIKDEKIFVKNDTCRSFIKMNKDTLEFVHVILIEYFDLILQYVNCLESPGNSFQFPALNFLTKFKRRIPFIKDCLGSLGDPDVFEKKCWMVCDKLNLMEISNFFDGDVKMIKRMYFVILSFFRKFSESAAQEERDQKDEVMDLEIDGMLVEPLSPGHLLTNKKFYAKKELREDIFGTKDTRIYKFSSKKKKRLDNQLVMLGLTDVAQVQQTNEQNKLNEKKIKILENQAEVMKNSLDLHKQEQLKKKAPEPGYNKKSKMKDQLYQVRLNNEFMNDGYFPQRKLKKFQSRNLSEKKLKKNKIQPRNLRKAKEMIFKNFTSNNQSPPTKVKEEEKPKIYHEKIENVNSIFLKNEAPIKIKDFKYEFGQNGMDFLFHYDLINYKYEINKIISHEFQLKERLNQQVVHIYLGMHHKYINNFNHNINKTIDDYYSLPFILEIKELEKRLQNAYEKKKDKPFIENIKIKIKLAKSRQSKAIFHSENAKLVKKYKKKQMDAKLKKKAQDMKVKIEDHVEKDYFSDNFHGFKDFFTGLFGTL